MPDIPLDLPFRPLQSTYSSKQPIRPHLKRGSPLSNGYRNDHETRNSLDSSDDEAPIPKLSAAAEELLGVRTGERLPVESIHVNVSRINYSNGSPVAKDTYAAPRILNRTQQTRSPTNSNAPSPRVIKISGGRLSSGPLRRAISIAGIHDESPLGMRNQSDLKTPAPRPGSFLSGSSRSPQEIGNQSAKGLSSGSELVGGLTRYGNRNEEAGVQGSIRIKRLGKMSGSFLSGPARRGMVRRQSEEDYPVHPVADDPAAEDENGEKISNLPEQPIHHQQSPSPLSEESRLRHKDHPIQILRPQERYLRQSVSPNALKRAPISSQSIERPTTSGGKATLASSLPKASPPELKSIQARSFLPSADQENIPPPTFKRDKSIHEILSSQNQPRLADIVKKVHIDASPSRKPLAAKSNNTPLRPPPPPPPKMSMLEAATTTSAANAKRKPRNMISVNGKHFTRMECIGRGGSGRVYRVMAENFKLFALKSVSLEDLDELTIRGFKGEIELLKKLQDVDRVVRLYDYEINEEKKVLRVLMDIGELDLRKILTPKLDEETGKLDITFTRYIWKEMLECVAAVHAFDIVHSDLKPDNFIMMQSRLKLIDFGIANVIQDDTVNVHREQQVGTPNYMSPETLVDTNIHNGKRPTGASKLMKVGKPSDVWSLGCILYQIVYGKPPFGHITNTVRKVMAITDKSHIITYPSTGLGGVPVPTGLIRTLRKCLDRDASKRPTIEQLLSMGDLFLHPDAPGTVPINVELLGRLQNNIIQHIVSHGVPSPAELEIWPKRFFESIKAAVEESRA